MTIGSSLGRVVYTGNNSTTAFAFNAPVAADTELKIFTVVIATGVQTLQTKGGSGTYDYSVSINAGTKFATITLNNPPPNTIRVVIIRNVPFTQTTDYVAGDPFPAETHEAALDKLTTIVAQISEVADRSVKVQESSATSNISMSELEADKVVKVNPSGTGLMMGPTTAGLETLATITTDIQAVAGISSNVTSVAGNATNINAVAADATDIGAVAAKATEIGRLGTTDAVADMNTLGTNTIVTNMATLAPISANITTVAGIDSNVNSVASNATNINAVAGAVTNVNTVASNIASVNTVATDIAKVVTVANDLNETVSEIETAALDLQETTSEIDVVANNITNVNTVGNNINNVNACGGQLLFAEDLGSITAALSTSSGNDINTVAGSINNINTVAGISSNITTVAGVSANVTTVAGISANVTTVASNDSNVTAVAGNATNINAVAGNATNINTVAGANANITTVATNISGVNSFADRYRVGSSDPTSSLDEGDLFYNSSENAVKYYTGSTWASITAGLGNIVEDTTPQLGGALDGQNNNMSNIGTIDGTNLQIDFGGIT